MLGFELFLKETLVQRCIRDNVQTIIANRSLIMFARLYLAMFAMTSFGTISSRANTAVGRYSLGNFPCQHFKARTESAGKLLII